MWDMPPLGVKIRFIRGMGGLRQFPYFPQGRLIAEYTFLPRIRMIRQMPTSILILPCVPDALRRSFSLRRHRHLDFIENEKVCKTIFRSFDYAPFRLLLRNKTVRLCESAISRPFCSPRSNIADAQAFAKALLDAMTVTE